MEPEAVRGIVYAACLAHDLGNPPFGHSGEEAIRDWFEKEKERKEFAEVLGDDEKKRDFLHFDGNAQGFRIITELSTWSRKGGMRLTYPVLAAFSKYPFPSKFSSDDTRKFGYPFASIDLANKLFKDLGVPKASDDTSADAKWIKWARHPLAFIVEAADDISYLTSDVDDAHRMRSIPDIKAIEWLNEIISLRSDVANDYKQIEDGRQKISYLRSVAATTLMKSAAESFESNYNSIMEGKAKNELLQDSGTKEAVTKIKEQFRKEVFRSSYKLELEAVGYNVIRGLMELFGGMVAQFIEKKR